MLDRRLLAGLAGGLWAATTASAATCTSDLLIDNFVKWTSGTNNLDWQNGDDGSMTSIAASAGQVVFVPKADGSSYFYESFPCVTAQTSGYGGLQFTIQGPAGASVSLELQTATNCNPDTTGMKSSYNIITDLTGRRQTVTMPLVGFDNDPNYDAIVGLAWSVFSQANTQWTIGNITLLCGSVAGGQPTSVAPAPTTASMSTRLFRVWRFDGMKMG
ncbi:hypothetical protein QBC47DRAFT_64161 [Echria macrotheca]|uniref:Uncharacterized protein n=1 Tax=Echria macrotheca TaxID=438768 RepID=A0AAJ0F277_9PEZI|nr:hypothetical protein QBC47DRAFT_64161 [Echria macrotheca]